MKTIPNATICESDLGNIVNYPLNPERMKIPRIQDKHNPKLAQEVDRLNAFSQFLSEDCFKTSHSFRLFSKDDDQYRDLKDSYVDIIFDERSQQFPQDLYLHHKLNLFKRNGHKEGVLTAQKHLRKLKDYTKHLKYLKRQK